MQRRSSSTSNLNKDFFTDKNLADLYYKEYERKSNYTFRKLANGFSNSMISQDMFKGNISLSKALGSAISHDFFSNDSNNSIKAAWFKEDALSNRTDYNNPFHFKK